MASNTEYKSWLSSEDETIVALEKAQSGRTTLDDIADALDEYKRLFIAGLASPAEKITLSRAYPENIEYAEACEMLKDDEGEMSLMVVGGPASVEVVDREGHLITTDALKKAFKKYMENFRGRNVMVMHSDVQVGHALPAYISKAGNIFKSGVDDKGLFFIAELRDDTKISNRVREQIEKGGMKSYSIAGSATKSKDIKKSDGSSILQVDDMELAEVTICEKGVNQNAHFELLKGDKAEGSCVDGSCLTKSHDPAPEPEIIAISKSEMPSFKDMFTSWIAKEQDSDKSRAIAIATAQAKKEGYKKFTDGSPGDERRDKIAEEIKRSLKKAEKEISNVKYGEEDKGGMKFRTTTGTLEGGRFREATPFAKPGQLSRSVYDPQTGKEFTAGTTYDEKGQKGIYVKQSEKRPTLEKPLRGGTTTQELSLTKQLFLDKLKEIV
jgi:HK97 family phage prohead protease